MICVNDEYLVLGESNGFFEIKQLDDNGFTDFDKNYSIPDNSDFKDIVLLKKDNNIEEYGFATSAGLYFGTF